MVRTPEGLYLALPHSGSPRVACRFLGQFATRCSVSLLERAIFILVCQVLFCMRKKGLNIYIFEVINEVEC